MWYLKMFFDSWLSFYLNMVPLEEKKFSNCGYYIEIFGSLKLIFIHSVKKISSCSLFHVIPNYHNILR
jgi:hypothetical protein